MTLLVDYRERRLAEVLEVPHLVRKLAVGDILCDYCVGNQWIAERKTATDLATSLISGRWRDQLHRLKETGCRIIFIVEGDLRSTTFRQLAWHSYQRRASQGVLRDQNSGPARNCHGRSTPR